MNNQQNGAPNQNGQSKSLSAVAIALAACGAIAIMLALALEIIQISPPDPIAAQTPDQEIHQHGNDEPHSHDSEPFIADPHIPQGPSLPIPVDNDCLIWTSAQNKSDYATAVIELNPPSAIASDNERRAIMRLLGLGDYTGAPNFDAPGWDLTQGRYRAAPIHPCIDYISIPLQDAPADYRDPRAYAECAPPLARQALARENNPQSIVDMPAAQAIEREGASPELYALTLIAKDAPIASDADIAAINALIREGSIPEACGDYNPRLKSPQAWQTPPRAYPIFADANETAINARDLPAHRDSLIQDGWTPALGAAPISAAMNAQEMTPTLKGWTLRLIACADDGVNCPVPNRDE